jgi:hypothetical protein
MDNPCLEVISYVERLHRQFLEVVKLELEGLRIHDINNLQAMMLFNPRLRQSQDRNAGIGAQQAFSKRQPEVLNRVVGGRPDVEPIRLALAAPAGFSRRSRGSGSLRRDRARRRSRRVDGR